MRQYIPSAISNDLAVKVTS